MATAASRHNYTQQEKKQSRNHIPLYTKGPLPHMCTYKKKKSYFFFIIIFLKLIYVLCVFKFPCVPIHCKLFQQILSLLCHFKNINFSLVSVEIAL